MSVSACLGRGRHLSLTQTAHLLCTDPIPEGDGWDYEPTPDESIKAIAEREGRSGFEVACKRNDITESRIWFSSGSQ